MFTHIPTALSSSVGSPQLRFIMAALNPEGLAVEKTRYGNLPRYGNFKDEQHSQGAAGFPEPGVVQGTLDAQEEPWKAAPMALRHFCRHCHLSMGSLFPMELLVWGFLPFQTLLEQCLVIIDNLSILSCSAQHGAELCQGCCVYRRLPHPKGMGSQMGHQHFQCFWEGAMEVLESSRTMFTSGFSVCIQPLGQPAWGS